MPSPHRGRPPVTRARVLTYIHRANPTSVAQIARALGVDRSSIYRILRAAYGPNFRQQWPHSAESDVSGLAIPIAA